MQSCSPVKHRGAIEWDGFDDLVAEVKAIPLDGWTYRSDPESYKTRVVLEASPHFPKKGIEDLLNAAGAHFEESGYTNRVVLSCVPAGEEILPHTDDFGPAVRRASYHCHIPLVTHPDIVIGFDSGPVHMKERSLYTMDETARHWVKNPTGVDRVHLLFAYFPHHGKRAA